MMQALSTNTLIEGFIRSVEKFPRRIALEIKSSRHSYAELGEDSHVLAALIDEVAGEERYVSILSSRTYVAYQGILASLLCAKAYLPIDLNAPTGRIEKIVKASASHTFVIDQEGARVLEKLIDKLEPSVFIFLDESLGSLCAEYRRGKNELKHRFFCRQDLQRINAFEDKQALGQDIAYLLFTSGSTGEPKGVPISNDNITAYLDSIASIYPLTELDRVSQAFDLGFDPSVQDMFLTWGAGATLCVMSDRERLGAASFIRKNNLSVWNTIPSIAKLIMQTSAYKEDNFSGLKFVFFNGELLSEAVATATQRAAINAKIINLYGLTETSINIAHYVWHSNSASECRSGVVPLGRLLNGEAVLVNERGQHGDEGVLWVSGPQVFDDYLANGNKRAEFLELKGTRFLNTGDWLARDNLGCLHFYKRVDEQIKIQGHRIEINEVRLALEKASSCVDALVLCSKDDFGEVVLLGFLQGRGPNGEDFDLSVIRSWLKAYLPNYMTLADIRVYSAYPRLASGKVDRNKLLALGN